MPDKQIPYRAETRTISGRGLFVIEPSKKVRRLFLYMTVVRLPKINFTSSKWNPDKSEYAKITWSRRDYILREDVLEWENQLFTWEQDSVAYAAYAHVCMYNSLIAYMDYLASGVGLQPLVRSGLIYMEPLQDLPDKIRIVCRGDTAIVADLWRYDYDLACPEADTESPPPPDPTPPEKVPTGFPIGDISPPYEMPDDGGDTVPNPSDETAPPEPDGEGVPCSIVTVNFEYLRLDGQTVQTSTTIFAPYYGIRVARTGTVGNNYGETIAIMCAIQNPNDCANGQRAEVGAGYNSAEPVAATVTFLGLS